ncbi:MULTISPECIES: response regulator transcription factor [Lacrimispora]|jgi:DNA-binding response OmpR family regulator|uniref:response regulator transcription factor n=1 Tax=Lacrimispora TaxID=2719231 RepID=UPI00047AAF6D|nr:MULTISPECIES: response regulator transcription factor [Lacrimispora]MBS5957519.1 response regulator transcription factor [Clostridiales bacterium]
MIKNLKNVLVVDDEPKILEVVCLLLKSKGFCPIPAENGKKALEIFEAENISLVLLDLMLPDLSGEEVCSAIRRKSRVPIIMLTAKVEENDVVEGFSLGADDYVIKPFGLKELYARIEAVLRRTEPDLIPLTRLNSWRDGDLIVDFEKNEVKKHGTPVTLTPSERNILSALIKYPGKVFTREELIETAMDKGFAGYDRAIDSHIKNIRKKIEDDPKSPVYVLTIPGLGYKFGG